MDFSKNVINKGTKAGSPPPPARRTRALNKIPARAGKRLGGSPDRINTLTGLKVKEEKKVRRAGGRMMKAGGNTQVITKPR